MANSIGNGIKIGFEAIKLVFTRWYTYFIAALLAGAMLFFGWLVHLLLKAALGANVLPRFQALEGNGAGYAMATNDSPLTLYIFNLHNWGSIASLAYGCLGTAAMMTFVDALLKEYRQQPISWYSLIVNFCKYILYTIPVMIFSVLSTIGAEYFLQSEPKVTTLLFMLSVVIIGIFFSFYIVQAVDTHKILVNFSRLLHVIKSNILNFIGLSLLLAGMTLLLSGLTASFEGLEAAKSVSENVKPHAVIQMILGSFFSYAAITLMYLRTPREKII